MLVPGNFEGQLGLALLNQKSKHFTEAFDQINSLVNQYPDSAVVYAARGGIEKERGWLVWPYLIILKPFVEILLIEITC